MEKYFVPLRIHIDFDLEVTSAINLENLRSFLLLSNNYKNIGLVLSNKMYGLNSVFRILQRKISLGFRIQVPVNLGFSDLYVYPSSEKNLIYLSEHIKESNLPFIMEDPLSVKIVVLNKNIDSFNMWESMKKKNFFWGLEQDFNLIPNHILERASNLPWVAFPKISYLNDYPSFDLLNCLFKGEKYFNKNRSKANINFNFKSKSDYCKIYRLCPESILNSSAISARSQWFKKSRKADLNFVESIKWDFVGRCFRGAIKNNCWDKDHALRLVYETRVILSKNFENYFALIEKIGKFCRKNSIIIGPRGSAAGALVSYCMGITNLDPLSYGLKFERFLNPDRKDLPDYDLDFPSYRRSEVINFMMSFFQKKYSLMHIATFTHLQSKNLIRNLGKVIGLSEFEIDSIAKRVRVISTKKTNLADLLEEDEHLRKIVSENSKLKLLFDASSQLENLITGNGIHAAGIVLIDKVNGSIYGDHINEDSGAMVSSADMHDLEYAGYVKLDILGIDSLSVIDYVINQNNIDLRSIDLNDQRTFDHLINNSTIGIFQITYVNSEILKKIRPKSIEDIADVIGLNRPGSMDYIPDFITRKILKQKNPEINLSCPGDCEEIRGIVEPTMNIFIWQEQVMELAQTIAGYSGAEADSLRKIIGKKKFDKMPLEENKFISGASKKISNQKAKILWDIVKNFKGYGFNKSHGISYALNTYYTAYLKEHYPLSYYSAWCNFEKNNEKLANIIQVCASEGYKIVAPDLNLSSAKEFYILKKSLILPLRLVLPINLAQGIELERKNRGNFIDMEDLSRRTGYFLKDSQLKKAGFENKLSFNTENNDLTFKYFKIWWQDLNQSTDLKELVYNHVFKDEKYQEIVLRLLEIKPLRAALPRDNTRISDREDGLILALSDGSFTLRLSVTKPEIVDAIKKGKFLKEKLYFKLNWRNSVKDFSIESIF